MGVQIRDELIYAPFYMVFIPYKLPHNQVLTDSVLIFINLGFQLYSLLI